MQLDLPQARRFGGGVAAGDAHGEHDDDEQGSESLVHGYSLRPIHYAMIRVSFEYKNHTGAAVGDWRKSLEEVVKNDEAKRDRATKEKERAEIQAKEHKRQLIETFTLEVVPALQEVTLELERFGRTLKITPRLDGYVYPNISIQITRLNQDAVEFMIKGDTDKDHFSIEQGTGARAMPVNIPPEERQLKKDMVAKAVVKAYQQSLNDRK